MNISINNNQNKKGSVLVLVSVFLCLFFISLAMVIDIGYIVNTEGHLQNIADSAALAGVEELIDEDLIRGETFKDQTDDITSARDYATLYASLNRSGFQVDRNDLNLSTGGVVVGYIDNPLDRNDAFETEGVSEYNSVKVTASLSSSINGPLQLIMGRFTDLDEVNVNASAVATIESRIVGFRLNEDETVPILPFAVWESAWEDAFDGIGDTDVYSVNPDTGQVTDGSDGIAEFLCQPWYPDLGIPGQTGNGRTVFITSTIATGEVTNQILYGMNKVDLENSYIDELILTDDGTGDFTKWAPGEHWMSSSWHTALNQIAGDKRIVPLFNSLSVGSSRPVATIDLTDQMFDLLHNGGLPNLEETCCGIYEWYELCGFQSVVVCESFWPSKEKNRRFYLQPAQIMVPNGVIESEMPQSNSVYALTLTR